jgi:hypothetical protein
MKHTEQSNHIKILIEKIWCQHQVNRFEVTMVTVTLKSQTSNFHGDTWSDLMWYYIIKKNLKRNMKNNHQNRCKNKNSILKNRKHIFCTLEPLFYMWISDRKNIDYLEDISIIQWTFLPIGPVKLTDNDVCGRLVQTRKWWVRLAKITSRKYN